MSKKTNKTKASSRKPWKNSRNKAANREKDAGIQEHEERGGSRDNDVEWYAGDEYLLADSARLPFANPAGFSTTVPAATKWTADGAVNGTMEVSVPAIASIHLAPTLGPDSGSTSPVNIQARRVFGFIRAYQTVNSAYNQVTLMMYLIAMTSLYSFYAFCARLYGLLGTYQHRNRALPKALFKAMNINFESFEDQKANFRYWLNDFGNSVGALALPADMSYTKRQMWLYQNVFKDGLNEKSQLYIYTPDFFFLYNAIGHKVGDLRTPSLEYIDVSTADGGITLSMLKEIANTMLSRVIHNNVVNSISGDIIKAYGYERIWQLVPLGEEYMVEPVLELNVLDQIHNLFIPRTGFKFGGTKEGRIIPDVAWEEIDAASSSSYIKPNYCVYGFKTTATELLANEVAGYTLGKDGVVIDFDKQDVTPADVMVATRLTAVPYKYKAGGTVQQIPESQTILCGSEVATRVKVWRANADNTEFSGVQQALVSNNAWTAMEVRPFYKHPIVYAITGNNTPTSPVRCDFSSDVENWTFLNGTDLYKLHETALKSEFKVPLVGRLIK